MMGPILKTETWIEVVECNESLLCAFLTLLSVSLQSNASTWEGHTQTGLDTVIHPAPCICAFP